MWEGHLIGGAGQSRFYPEGNRDPGRVLPASVSPKDEEEQLYTRIGEEAPSKEPLGK